MLATRDGIFLRFNDGYRDNKTQTRIYNEWLQGKHSDTPHVATPVLQNMKVVRQ